MEYYEAKAAHYKQACGILRNRISQAIEVLADPNISNDKKVSILSAEMEIIANSDVVSYDSLELYDEDYVGLVGHSEEYEDYAISKQDERQR